MAAPAGGNGQADQSLNVIVMVGGIVLFLMTFWWLERTYIVDAIFAIRSFEIALLKPFFMGWNAVASWLHLPTLDFKLLQTWALYMHTADPSKVQWNDIVNLSDNVGRYLRYPVTVMLLGLAAYVYKRPIFARYSNTHDMQSLKKCENEIWPQITPVSQVDLVNTDIEKGEWAMAQTPLQFCKQNELLFNETKEETTLWKLHEAQAHEIFVLQMGPLWRDPMTLPVQMRALIAVFCACAHRDRAAANRLLDQIAAQSASGKLNFDGVDDLLKRYEESEILKWITVHHGFVYTAMATLLDLARKDGVLATAEFLWLKPVDRRLWFMLNSVGRQTACVEVAGPFAHWVAEKKLKRAIRIPMVKEAVSALSVSVDEILYEEQGEQWQSNVA